MDWLEGSVSTAEAVFAPWEAAGWVLELDSVLRRPMDMSGGPVIRAMARRGDQRMVLAWNGGMQLAQAFPGVTVYEDELAREVAKVGFPAVYVPGGVVTEDVLAHFRKVGMNDAKVGRSVQRRRSGGSEQPE